EAEGAIAVPREDGLAVTSHNLFTNRHAFGAVIGSFGLAARDRLTGGNPGQRIAGASIGVGLRVGLALVRPAEPPDRHLAAINSILDSPFRPELGNDHQTLADALGSWTAQLPKRRPVSGYSIVGFCHQ